MYRLRRLPLGLALAAATFGQVPSGTLHVRGTVTDSTTRQPIPNVRVQMTGGATALTSVNGNYDIPVAQIGSYTLRIEAQGYRPARDPYPVVLTGQSESVTLDMQMYRPSVITGRLIDAETKRPIAGFRVSANRVTYRLGRASMGLVPASGVTNPQGIFRIEQLLAGAYTLWFAPSIPERMVNSDTPPARETALGYRRQRWPNSGNNVELRSGDLLEVGDVSLSREPLYKVTGVLSGCPNGDDFSRGLLMSGQAAGHLQVPGTVVAVACGERFYAENLAPGEYTLQLNVERAGVVRLGIVNVLDRDVEFNPVFSMPLTISGSVIAPENFPALDQLRVAFVPGPAPTAPVEAAPVAPNGKFELTQVTAEPVEVQVMPVPAPYYVSEMLYNGAPLRDGILEVNPYSVGRELKIRIAEDGARLTGTVREKGELAPNSSVILVAWPERLKNGFPVHYVANATNGQFTFTGLPPGSYRAVAVEREAWETELQKPGVLSALIPAGAQVELASSSSREVALELRWVQR